MATSDYAYKALAEHGGGKKKVKNDFTETGGGKVTHRRTTTKSTPKKKVVRIKTDYATEVGPQQIQQSGKGTRTKAKVNKKSGKVSIKTRNL